MQGQTKELWVSLCEQAATEQNPERLIQLIAEIDRLLRKKKSGSKISAIHKAQPSLLWLIPETIQRS